MSDPAMEMNDPGPKPRLEWMDKDCFVVDHHYQRHTDSERSQAVIAKIARNFLWSRFQPPTVTPGPRGKYLVIDGQHRIQAAKRRDDIKKIPVYVVPEMDRTAQAENFVAINRDRAALHPLSVHRALVTMRDPEALKVQEVCEDADVSIAKQPAPMGMTKPRETAAIGTIKRGIRMYGEESVIAALMIIPEAYKLVPGMMRSRTLEAMMHLFHDLGVRNVERRALVIALKQHDLVETELKAGHSARKNGGRPHDALVNFWKNKYAKALKGE